MAADINGMVNVKDVGKGNRKDDGKDDEMMTGRATGMMTGRAADHRNLNLAQLNTDVVRGRSGGKIIWQPRILLKVIGRIVDDYNASVS